MPAWTQHKSLKRSNSLFAANCVLHFQSGVSARWTELACLSPGWFLESPATSALWKHPRMGAWVQRMQNVTCLLGGGDWLKLLESLLSELWGMACVPLPRASSASSVSLVILVSFGYYSPLPSPAVFPSLPWLLSLPLSWSLSLSRCCSPCVTFSAPLPQSLPAPLSSQSLHLAVMSRS